MHAYRNAGGDSGVVAYALGDGWITVRFAQGGCYRYTDDKPGAAHVSNMQRLARQGAGLATYINQHVRENYASRDA